MSEILRACLRCRRPCSRLWCSRCVHRGRVRMIREARKPLAEREVYRDLNAPEFLRSVREALDAIDKRDDAA